MGAQQALQRQDSVRYPERRHGLHSGSDRQERGFFDDDGFTLCDTPVLTPAACEGTTTLFEVKYFEDKAFLTQSGQLYNEATAEALGKVYCFGPTFRAEKSKTRRHLTEFWMVEPEVAYATVDDMMDLSERMITFVVQRCLERRGNELKALERDLSKLEKVSMPFPRISYDEALQLLRKFGSVPHAGFGMGIERAVTWICGLEHVRETIPFPRMLYRLTP